MLNSLQIKHIIRYIKYKALSNAFKKIHISNQFEIYEHTLYSRLINKSDFFSIVHHNERDYYAKLFFL